MQLHLWLLHISPCLWGGVARCSWTGLTQCLWGGVAPTYCLWGGLAPICCLWGGAAPIYFSVFVRWCETKHFKKGLTNIPHHFKRIEYLMTPRLRVTIWIKRGGNLPSPLPMDLSNPEHASHTCASMHSSMHLIHAHHPSSMRISCISSIHLIHAHTLPSGVGRDGSFRAGSNCSFLFASWDAVGGGYYPGNKKI